MASRQSGSSPRARGAGATPCMAGPSHTVHPHGCGERMAKQSIFLATYGSSPRARGVVGSVIRSRVPRRFIPAYAGSRHDVERPGGSSPRARGAVLWVPAAGAVLRFIPACAGSRYKRALYLHLASVHPHVRGEQPNIDSTWRNAHGSSPRARGADHRPGNNQLAARFIPVCAGSSSMASCSVFASTVHPRMRGEQSRRLR